MPCRVASLRLVGRSPRRGVASCAGSRTREGGGRPREARVRHCTTAAPGPPPRRGPFLAPEVLRPTGTTTGDHQGARAPGAGRFVHSNGRLAPTPLPPAGFPGRSPNLTPPAAAPLARRLLGETGSGGVGGRIGAPGQGRRGRRAGVGSRGPGWGHSGPPAARGGRGPSPVDRQRAEPTGEP